MRPPFPYISESKLASPQMDNESADLDSSLTSAIMDKNAPHSQSKLASPQMDNESADLDSSLTSAIMDKNAPHSQHLHDTSTNVITQEQEPVPQTMPTCSLDLEAGSPLTQQSTSNMTSLSLNFSQLVKDLEEKLKKKHNADLI